MVLNFFHPHLRSGEYFVIEDGLLSEGVRDALDDLFESREREYEVDASLCDLFGYNMTWNLNGYIRKR
jgi:cephalosporin hydroxylase